MPRRFRVLLALLLVHLLAACGTTVRRDTAPLTFVVVRHAEKATDDPENPGLSAAGRARATALAERLRDTPLVATYATEFRRTQQTAQPAAALHGVPVQAYFARGPAAEVVAQWRQAHDAGTVLVVGHSNTVPAIIAALGGPAVTIADEEFDGLFVLTVPASAAAAPGAAAAPAPTLVTLRYGAPTAH